MSGSLQMKCVLVTGGAGFIGSNFVRFLLSNNLCARVVNYDKLTYAGNPDNLLDFSSDSRYVFVKGDVCDFGALEDAVVRYGVDTIVHMAAESHVDRSISDSTDFVMTNVFGTQVVLEVVKKHNLRLHHVSTDEVFGSLGKTGFFSEASPYDPKSPYSATKAGSDHLVRAYVNTHGVRATISNCPNNYGPYQYPEKIIPLFITNLIDGKKVGVYGDGRNVRDWIYVVDHCEAIWRILKDGRMGETYMVGARCEISNIELTRKVLSIMGRDESSIEFIEDRKGHDFRYAVDPSKIERELKWKARTRFDDGLRATVDWYVKNEAWWRKLKLKQKQDQKR